MISWLPSLIFFRDSKLRWSLELLNSDSRNYRTKLCIPLYTSVYLYIPLLPSECTTQWSAQWAHDERSEISRVETGNGRSYVWHWNVATDWKQEYSTSTYCSQSCCCPGHPGYRAPCRVSGAASLIWCLQLPAVVNEREDESRNESMNGWMNEWMNEWKNDGWTAMVAWIDWWPWLIGWIHRWQMDCCGWVDGWKDDSPFPYLHHLVAEDGWMGGWMDRWKDDSSFPYLHHLVT